MQYSNTSPAVKKILYLCVFLALSLRAGIAYADTSQCKPGDNWSSTDQRYRYSDHNCNEKCTCTSRCTDGSRTDDGCCNGSCHEPPSPTPTPCPPLGVPASLGFSCNSGTSITLNWGSAANAAYYALRVDDLTDGWNGTCSSANGDFCADVSGTSYVFSAKPGHKYNWWVHSRNYCGAWSASTGGPATSCIPNCSNINGSSTIVLGSAGNFSASYESLSGALHGQIFRDNFTDIGNSPVPGTAGNLSYSWSPSSNDLGTHTVYCRAFNQVAECRDPSLGGSPPVYTCNGPVTSMTVNVVTPTPTPCPPLPAPSNLACANLGSSVRFSWSDNSNTEVGYNVYRDGGSTPLAQLGANSISYIDTQIACDGTNHIYTVGAYDQCITTLAVSSCSGLCFVPTATPTITATPSRTLTPTKTPTRTQTPIPQTPTPTVIPSQLAITKTSSPSHITSFVWQILYTIHLQNTGSLNLSNILLRDDLSSVFNTPSGTTFQMVAGSLSSNNPSVPGTSSFDGKSTTTLVGSGSLSAGGSADIQFSVQVTVPSSSSCFDYRNTVTGQAVRSGGVIISSSSTDSSLNICPPTPPFTPTPTLVCMNNFAVSCSGQYRVNVAWQNPAGSGPYANVGGMYGARLTPTIIVRLTPAPLPQSIDLDAYTGGAGTPPAGTPIKGFVGYPRYNFVGTPTPAMINKICLYSFTAAQIASLGNYCEPTATPVAPPPVTPLTPTITLLTPTFTPTPLPSPWYKAYNSSYTDRGSSSNYVPDAALPYGDDGVPVPASYEAHAAIPLTPYFLEGKPGIATFRNSTLPGIDKPEKVSRSSYFTRNYNKATAQPLIARFVGSGILFKRSITTLEEIWASGVYTTTGAYNSVLLDSSIAGGMPGSAIQPVPAGSHIVLVINNPGTAVTINSDINTNYDFVIITNGTVEIAANVKFIKAYLVANQVYNWPQKLDHMLR